MFYEKEREKETDIHYRTLYLMNKMKCFFPYLFTTKLSYLFY